MADPNDPYSYNYFPQGDPGGYGANQQPALPPFTDALGNAFGGAFNNIRGGLTSLGGILSGLAAHPPVMRVPPTQPQTLVGSPNNPAPNQVSQMPPRMPTPTPDTSGYQPSFDANAPIQSTASPATSAGGVGGYGPSFGPDFRPQPTTVPGGTLPQGMPGRGVPPWAAAGYHPSFGPGFRPGGAAPPRVTTHVAQHPATSRFTQARAQAPAAAPARAPAGPATDPNVIRWMPAGGRGGSAQGMTALPSSGNVTQRLFSR